MQNLGFKRSFFIGPYFISLAGVSMVLLCGCGGFSLSPEPERYQPKYAPELSVFAMISPDERYEFVIVERTSQLNEPQYVLNIIKDAQVKMIGAGDTAAFTFFQDKRPCGACSPYYREGIYLDQNRAFRARAGETYNLIVETPGGGRVTGTAQVPQIPKITAPLPETKILKSALLSTKVFWQDDPETAAYQLAFLIKPKSAQSRFDALTEDDIFVSPPATLEKMLGYYFFDYDNLEKIATIKVMAMDRNYYDYQRNNSDIATIAGQNLRLLEGGLGVFAAVNVDSVNVVLE